MLDSAPGFADEAVLDVRGAVTYVRIPQPRMGGKVWLLDRKGIFVLEEGPGLLRTIACTHAGAGSLLAIDGIPDEKGFFQGYSGNDLQRLISEGHLPSDYFSRSGKPIYKANPAVMGSWMLEGGFHHGLTIISKGGNSAVSAIASIVWLAEPQAKAKTGK